MLARIRHLGASGRSVRAWLLTCALLAAWVPAQDTHAGAPRPPPSASAVATAFPDSVRLKVLALLSEGNVTGAVEYFIVATGARQTPRWLQNLQSAFNAANRVAGRCADVARKIHEGFSALGKAPGYIRVTSTESELLAFETRAGVSTSTVQISDNNYHVAVRVGSRIYDAFTGPQGLTESEYLGRLFTPAGKIVLEEVAGP